MADHKQSQSQRYWDTAFPIFILMASRRLNTDVPPWHYPELRRAMPASARLRSRQPCTKSMPVTAAALRWRVSPERHEREKQP